MNLLNKFKTVSTYKPNPKTTAFVFISDYLDLVIYDAGVEQEEVSPEIISETLSLPTQNTPSIQTRKIHIVTRGRKSIADI